MAEEVYFLYPESDWALERLKDDPAHLLFRRYGESVPEDDWNAVGTKQGIYMMGPDGEYLDGLHAASGSADRMVRRLERALERWATVSKEKEYANLSVPAGDAVAPPEIEAAPMALRVSLRDLPGAAGDPAGRRFGETDQRSRRWTSFTRWAWNQNWLTIDEPTELVPGGATAIERQVSQPVAAAVVDRICRNVLIDNVRGQNPPWSREALQEAELSMVVLSEVGDLHTIEYRGHARLATEGQAFAPKLYGRAVWDQTQQKFVSFQLVAIGERSGAARFNQREHDQGPAPMGIVLDLF